MKIRPATLDDMPALHRLGRAFHATTPYADVAYCPDSIRTLCAQLIDSGYLLLAEIEGYAIGLVGATIGPLFINRDALVCSEVFWWVDPEARSTGAGKALAVELERLCRAAGIYRLAMVGIHGAELGKVEQLYERLGFQATENMWSKVLWQR